MAADDVIQDGCHPKEAPILLPMSSSQLIGNTVTKLIGKLRGCISISCAMGKCVFSACVNSKHLDQPPNRKVDKDADAQAELGRCCPHHA